jgi:hypothetical protein
MKEVNNWKKRRRKKNIGLRSTDVKDMFETFANAAYKFKTLNGKKAERFRRRRDGRKGKLKPEKR